MKYSITFKSKYGKDTMEVDASSIHEATDVVYDKLMEIFNDDDMDVEFLSAKKVKS